MRCRFIRSHEVSVGIRAGLRACKWMDYIDLDRLDRRAKVMTCGYILELRNYFLLRGRLTSSTVKTFAASLPWVIWPRRASDNERIGWEEAEKTTGQIILHVQFKSMYVRPLDQSPESSRPNSASNPKLVVRYICSSQAGWGKDKPMHYLNRARRPVRI